jgi:hypothetical protein
LRARSSRRFDSRFEYRRLRLLLLRSVGRHRGADELLEAGFVDLVTFAEVDRAPRVASRLELKSLFGSSIEAPRKNVSFTTCLYDSPVQTPPSCDQTGVPPDVGFSHFHSSSISGSASWMSCRT